MSTTTETPAGAHSVSDILRKQFAPELVGKLPRVTCGDCSDRRKQCDRHQKQKCQVCQAYVSTAHIHIDYVGHADVTARLLEADPEWTWEPQARDVDPAVMAAAVASGDPEVVRMVLENAPPKFDLDDHGSPIGLWIRLTIGGATKPGYGSVPSGQPDAVKVLIGDALRNAAMRFGVALDLWAKGDRADPTAENATASAGQAARGRQQQERANGRREQDYAAEQPATAPAQADPAVIADWGAKVDEIATQEDADRVDAELKAIFKGGSMDATTANAIRGAIKQKAASLKPPTLHGHSTAAPDDDTVRVFSLQIGAAASVSDLQKVWVDIRAAGKVNGTVEIDGKPVTLTQLVNMRKAELQAAEPEMAGAR